MRQIGAGAIKSADFVPIARVQTPVPGALPSCLGGRLGTVTAGVCPTVAPAERDQSASGMRQLLLDPPCVEPDFSFSLSQSDYDENATLDPYTPFKPKAPGQGFEDCLFEKIIKKKEVPPGFPLSRHDPISKSRSSCGIQSSLLKASQGTFQLGYNVTRLRIKIPEREVKMRAE